MRGGFPGEEDGVRWEAMTALEVLNRMSFHEGVEVVWNGHDRIHQGRHVVGGEV